MSINRIRATLESVERLARKGQRPDPYDGWSEREKADRLRQLEEREAFMIGPEQEREQSP